MSIYPLMIDGLVLFQDLAITISAAKTWENMYLCGMMFLNLLGKYLEREYLGQL